MLWHKKIILLLILILTLAVAPLGWAQYGSSDPSDTDWGTVVRPIQRKGTNSTQVQGAAANGEPMVGNPVPQGFYVEADAAQLDSTGQAEGDITRGKADIEGRQLIRTDHPNRFTAGFNAIAATLTQIQAAPGAGLSLWITDIFIQTTTGTSGTYAFQYGTGTNCGTGTTALFPVSGTANRFNAPPTTAAGQVIPFNTPLKVAANNALCVIGVVTNTVSGQVSGFIAP